MLISNRFGYTVGIYSVLNASILKVLSIKNKRGYNCKKDTREDDIILTLKFVP